MRGGTRPGAARAKLGKAEHREAKAQQSIAKQSKGGARQSIARPIRTNQKVKEYKS